MAQLCFLVDYPRYGAAQAGQTLAGYERGIIESKCARAGLLPQSFDIIAISPQPRYPNEGDRAACLAHLNSQNYDCIIPLDEGPLQLITGKRSIWKWHLSPLDTVPELKCRKAVPSFHPDQIRKDMTLNLYLEMSVRKAASHLTPGPWIRKERRFLLNPSFDHTLSVLRSIKDSEYLSIDIETGRNQINTFGVAWSANDAIAVRVLPDGLPPNQHYELWSVIRDLLEGPAKKIMQNGLYERSYFSRYGIHVTNFTHDTMCAMKFLWAELEKGLDNVGRIHTMEPYWKDIGKVASEEGKQKDWGDIRDWDRHYLYNCLDSANTYEAAMSQREALSQRGLLPLYETYVSRLFDPTYEMSVVGLPLNPEKRDALVSEYEARSAALVSQLSEEINPRSSKQKIELFRKKGIVLPRKKNKQTGKTAPSADELSLKKTRLKHPDDPDIKLLLEIAGIEKALSSYLRVKTFPDNRIRFSLDPFSTETGRMACRKDAWDGGFNAQTMTDYVKGMIEFRPELDRVFMEIDLSQAESRFVAYDSCEETLLGMLERREDIHRYVAAEIYCKPMGEITHEERQLGKKSGHGANYSMGPATFQDSCLKEMDLVLDRKMATRVLEAYHRLFPGIRKWHAHIRETVYRERKLTNPLGLERYFYGRLDDATFREAYAYRPQSCIPMVTNYLMLALTDRRREGKMDFILHAQIHDSVLLSCRNRDVPRIADYALATGKWHPEVILPAGRLVIPTDVKTGRCLGEMKKYA